MLSGLKDYQSKAVNHLITTTSMMLDRTDRQNICVLRSPTGSGKTFMAAAFIDGLIRRREDDICFIWVTIGKGELQIQSRNALSRYFRGSPAVRLIEEEFTGGKTIIEKNEIIVVNWEKLRNKVKGEWANNLMKDGEKTNFREVLANTREKRKIILIIDESHIGATAERTQELRDEFDANVIIEISATPKLTPSPAEMASGRAGWIEVSSKDVIEEGMIKREIIINPDLSDKEIEGADSQDVVLERAYQKRLELQKYFDEEDVDINPLVLIQIPNADAGDQKIEAIRDFLAEKDITEANARLAIWLSEYPSSEHLDGISLNTSPVQFLIFKQAIDTGWDCPRAHILVKFREAKSEIFEIQILGRILRMPEQKHYVRDELNIAYVYTNISEIAVKREDYNPNIIKHIKASRKSLYKNIELPSYYKSRADYGDITGDITEIFSQIARTYFEISKPDDFDGNKSRMTKKGLVLDNSRLQDQVVKDIALDSTEFDSLEGEISTEDFVILQKSKTDAQIEFDKFLQDAMGTFTNVARSVPALKAALFSFFRKNLGFTRTADAFWLHKIVLEPNNKAVFKLLLDSSVAEFSKQREIIVKERVEGGEQNYTFEVPEYIFINEYLEEQVESERNILSPCYLFRDRSQVEKTFEKRIDSDTSIEWWFKNGVNKIEFFGIKYEYPVNKIKSFYPDYIIKYKDGTLGIFETKSKGDDENLGGLNKKTQAKAEAMAKWRNVVNTVNKKIRTGIVIVDGKNIRLNESEFFNTEKALSGDWTDWNVF
jgi:type III restriction enzyme